MQVKQYSNVLHFVTTAIVVLGAGLVLPPNASAAGPTISGILAGSWQHANGSKSALVSPEGEANAQLDLLFGLPMGPGSWQMEVKAGTTPRGNGVSEVFPETAGLVGETLDSAGKGRAAITQFYYQAAPSFGTISAGLLFVPALIDTNPIANDEYREFLGTVFVNNPTIALPVYVIGGGAQGSISKAFGYTLIVTSTADLHQNSYENLFDFNGNGHGVFAAAEFDWHLGGLSGNFGIWQNDDGSFTSFASGNPETDYGAYANANGTLRSKALRWNVRLGWANPEVSAANVFLGVELAYDSKLPVPAFARPVTYGIGMANTWVSPDMTGLKADRQQAEVYAKTSLVDGFSFTIDMQYIRHSQFAPDDASTWVEGTRVAVEF